MPDDNKFKLMSMWKQKDFVLIWLVIFINISCGLALISVASPIMTEQKASTSVVALTISIMGIFNGTGRLLFSAISDKLKQRQYIYYVILISSIVATSSAFITKNTTIIAIALIIVSACYGAGFSCLPSLLSDIFGMDNISKIHGLSLTAWAMAGLVGNQISNFVKSATGSYTNVFLVLMALYAIAIIFVFAIRKEKK